MLKTAHKMALTALALLCTCGGGFAADNPTYDRKIEAAVKQIVAKKVGAIRGAYDFDTKTVKVAEFQGPFVPPIFTLAALPAVFDNADEELVVVLQSPLPVAVDYGAGLRFNPVADAAASVKLVQVAAVASRKVRVLSSFLYY